MKRFISILCIWLTIAGPCWAADLTMTVDTALAEVPVNKVPLVDDTDFKSIEGAVAYNAAGMALRWHFVATDGSYTVTSVTPTTGGTYDWTDQGDSGVYTIEIPASAGASINNDTEGVGWFTGVATGILPWTGPTIQFSPANIANSLVNGTDKLEVDPVQWNGTNVATPDTAGYPKVTIKDGQGTGEIDTANGLVTARNGNPGRVWYVDDTDGAGDTGTYEAPFDDYASAESAASPGDTIFFRAGTYTGQIDMSKQNLTLRGEGIGSSVITHDTGATILIKTGTVIDGLDVRSTDATAGQGINVKFSAEIYNVTLRDSLFIGPLDGVLISGAHGLVIDSCRFESTYDGANLASCRNLFIRNSSFTTDATHATDNVPKSALIANAAHGRIVNSSFTAARTTAGGDALFGVQHHNDEAGTFGFRRCLMLENCDVKVTNTHASGTADCKGIGVDNTSYGCRMLVVGGAVYVDNDGSGITRSLDAGAGRITVVGAAYDSTTTNGTIRTLLSPTTNDQTLDVATTGEAGLDFNNIKQASGATTLNNVTVPTVTDVTNGVGLDDDAITAAKFDESTAFPLASADSGDTTVLRKGSSAITGTTLDTAIDGISAGTSPIILAATQAITVTNQTTIVLADGPPDNDVLNGHTAIFVDQSNPLQVSSVQILDYVGATETMTLATAPGFTVATGDFCTVVSAPPATVSGTVDANVVSFEGGVLGTLDNAYAGSQLEADLATKSSQASVDDVPTNTEFEARTIAAANYATASALGTVDDFVDDLEGRVTATRAGYWDNLSGGAVATAATQTTQGGQLTNLLTAFELDGSVYRLTTNALEQAPAGEGGGATPAQIWAFALSGETGAGTASKALQDVLNDTATLPSDPADQSDLEDAIAAVGDLELTSEQVDQIADDLVAAGVGVSIIPVNQVPVPTSRTWRLKQSNSGLVGESSINVIESDSSQLFAIDFDKDLPNNGRLTDVNSVTIISGTAGGVTFGESIADVDDYGVDRSLAKIRMTPATAGTYVIRVSVDYANGDGSGTAVGDVRLVVRD